MKTSFIILLFPFLIQQQNNYQIDFGEEKKGRYWSVVNDGVMGGLSRGSKKLTKNSLLFKGNVSLDNNGGFSSLRRSFSEFDISNFEYVEIKYRSSGISLALTFAVSRRWYVPNYKVSLDRTSSNWNAKSSLDSLNLICKELHKGLDGISKTWSEVAINISSTF